MALPDAGTQVTYKASLADEVAWARADIKRGACLVATVQRDGSLLVHLPPAPSSSSADARTLPASTPQAVTDDRTAQPEGTWR